MQWILIQTLTDLEDSVEIKELEIRDYYRGEHQKNINEVIFQYWLSSICHKLNV